MGGVTEKMAARSCRWVSKRKREWARRKKAVAEQRQHWAVRFRTYKAACREWARRHFSSDCWTVCLVEAVMFHLLSLVEATVIVTTLCFFYLRYGFRL